MYAIIEIGGKQYVIEKGAIIKVEKMRAPEGEEVNIDKVLFVKLDGRSIVGNPYIEGARVKAKILEHGKNKKVIIFKYKRKKNYRRKRGHRQPFTKIEVEDIFVS
ncbi:MAG: 50S ribosomal protein L21 [Synergistetes bacterium]|nr:50S ribosomal protein L21 [Synergistota bacterium]MCX8128444.1 50S ribosomal protein L21 [Synergistota bacterium]MDW8193135.1 50S ribosomal protein L21 [Synergistota bacterium]